MYWRGEKLPIVYFYQDGKLVWEYVLPDELEKTKYGFQVRGSELQTINH